jgi:hypothetical protein
LEDELDPRILDDAGRRMEILSSSSEDSAISRPAEEEENPFDLDDFDVREEEEEEDDDDQR